MIKRRKKRRFWLFGFLLGTFLFVLLFLYIGSIFMPFLFSSSNFLSPIPIVSSKSSQIKTFFVGSPNKELQELLLKNKVNFKSINAGPEYSYVVKLNGGEEVIFSSKKSLVFQVDSLQFVLSRLTIEGKTFTRLDLRFDKPVIAFRE